MPDHGYTARSADWIRDLGGRRMGIGRKLDRICRIDGILRAYFGLTALLFKLSAEGCLECAEADRWAKLVADKAGRTSLGNIGD